MICKSRGSHLIALLSIFECLYRWMLLAHAVRRPAVEALAGGMIGYSLSTERVSAEIDEPKSEVTPSCRPHLRLHQRKGRLLFLLFGLPSGESIFYRAKDVRCVERRGRVAFLTFAICSKDSRSFSSAYRVVLIVCADGRRYTYNTEDC